MDIVVLHLFFVVDEILMKMYLSVWYKLFISCTLVCLRLQWFFKYSNFLYTAGCGDPYPPTGGFIADFDSAEETATITYRCRPGLVPQTGVTAVCTNMNWNPSPAALECMSLVIGNWVACDLLKDLTCW